MKCDNCGERPAVIFVQQVSRETTIELHLCEQCATLRGLNTSTNKIDISLGGLFSNILEGTQESSRDIRSCSFCGRTAAQIHKLKKAGCPECYTNFRSEILALMRSEGIDVCWNGTLPGAPEKPHSTSINRDDLKHELQRAIDNEDYEMAAYYRDRLRSIREKDE